MRTQACMVGNSIYYPAQLWPYLNWALSLRAVGCDVIWLEILSDEPEPEPLTRAFADLTARLEPYGFGGSVALATASGGKIDPAPPGALEFGTALEADVLLDLGYSTPQFVTRFKRSVLVDLDPGQTQIWAATREFDISAHDVHISIGEGVEAPDRPFPDAGLEWIWLPTAVYLHAWPPSRLARPGAPYTTISHWWDESATEIDGEWVENSKQAGFEPFLSLPSLTSARLELALGGLEDPDEQARLESLGWSVVAAEDVAARPDSYRQYVYSSRGELTAAKLPYSLLRSGWLNDRTASYLAAGKPAIVQRTMRAGTSRLPDGEGLLRFDTVQEAAAALERVESDYEHHALAARHIAERHFDGRAVATRALELAFR